MRESKHAFDGYVELILMELRSVTRLTLILFLILFPNLYYFMSFEPCFRCHSFEAALVHAWMTTEGGAATGMEERA